MVWSSRCGAAHLEVIGADGPDRDDQPDQGHGGHRARAVAARYHGLSNTKMIAALVASRPRATLVTPAEATALQPPPAGAMLREHELVRLRCRYGLIIVFGLEIAEPT